MDHSTATLGPLPSPQRDRRHRLRHKLCTPVYVSFNGPQTGMVVDLSELLDLNEDGFSAQTAPQPASSAVGCPGSDAQSSECLDINRPVTLCLDLPETKSYVHGSGLVIWRDDSGRVGIRFSFLPDRAQAVLKEWLFVNMLIACSNYAARAEQLANHRQEESSSPETAQAVNSSPASPIPDRAQLLSALDDVRRQVREIETQAVEARQDCTDTILQLIAERAMTLTSATGSALALLTDGRMVCRARSGEPAPPLGAEVNVREGLSGECARTGQAVCCEDTASDPRVDSELCRALGLASFLAVPIASDLRVVGLLEVFSPRARSFSNSETATLERLAELVPRIEADHADFSQNGANSLKACAEDSITAQTVSAESTVQESAFTNPMPAEPETSDFPTPGLPAGATTTQVTIPEPASPGSAPSDSGMTSPDAGPEEASRATVPLHDLRDTLWEPESESNQPHREGLDEPSEPKAKLTASSLRAHIGLLMSSLAAVALVLGYLLAPVIERHLNSEAQAAQNSSATLPVSYPAPNSAKVDASSPESLRKQAEEGNAEAQWRLGTLYRNGDGVKQSDMLAVEWFQRSAEQEYVPALTALGSHYWAGRGVPQDYAKAYFWYQLALAEGDQNSKLALEGIAAQLTQHEINKVRLQAEAWLNAHSQLPKRASN